MPVALWDIPFGDPANSSNRYEADIAPTKPGDARLAAATRELGEYLSMEGLPLDAGVTPAALSAHSAPPPASLGAGAIRNGALRSDPAARP